MAIDFDSILTPEQKKGIVMQRMQEFAAQAYQITINKSVIEASTDEAETKATMIANADKDLATLENAINAYKAELDAIGDVA